MALLGSALAGLGAFYLYTAVVLGWRGLALAPSPARPRSRPVGPVRRIASYGWRDRIRSAELLGTTLTLFALGGLGGLALFGGVVPAFCAGLLTAALLVGARRERRRRRLARAQEAWPGLIEEMRVLTGSLGRSIPQALFEVGRRAPDDLRPAFDAAHRVWLVSTDFEQTVTVLKAGLVDATADAACETLLVAHDLGGADLDRRLADLAEDRRHDIHDRKDARAKQAGARFARRFVLAVPLGMGLVGLSIGAGRAAYQTPMGQVAVAIALVLLAGCWLWAGQLMRLPRSERVFTE